MSKHAAEKCGQLRISFVQSSKIGITATKLTTLEFNLICSTTTVKKKSCAKFSLLCQSMLENSAENCVFQVF